MATVLTIPPTWVKPGAGTSAFPIGKPVASRSTRGTGCFPTGMAGGEDFRPKLRAETSAARIRAQTGARHPLFPPRANTAGTPDPLRARVRPRARGGLVPARLPPEPHQPLRGRRRMRGHVVREFTREEERSKGQPPRARGAKGRPRGKKPTAPEGFPARSPTAVLTGPSAA